MDKVELRNSRKAGWLLIVLFKLGMGVFLCGAVIVGLGQGKPLSEVWLLGAAALGLLAMGAYDLAQVNNQAVQITLTPEGLLDHRMRQKRLLPWSAVTHMFHDTNDSYIVQARLDGMDPGLFGGPGTAKALLRADSVTIQLGYLDVNSKQFERLVHGFAPHIVMSGLFSRPHDAKGRVRGSR